MTTLIGFDYAAAPKVDVPTCPVCGLANPSTPATDRFGCAIGVSGCWQCGLAYLNPRLTPDAYDAFYQGPYRQSVEAHDPLYTHTVFLAQQRRIGLEIGSWLQQQHIDVAQRILDIGGSTGETALTMGCVPALTTILDVAEDELAHARRLGFDTIVGAAEDVRMEPGTFDGVLCVQTFDHLTDPLAVLRHIDAPWLYLDVVDHARHCRKRVGRPLFKIDHPLNWSERALRLALKQTGWRIDADHTRSNHIGVLCRRGL